MEILTTYIIPVAFVVALAIALMGDDPIAGLCLLYVIATIVSFLVVALLRALKLHKKAKEAQEL